MRTKIKVVGFDADDTLWNNETFYHLAEQKFCVLLQQYAGEGKVSELLFQTEMQNLPLYGFGAKGFTLSMIETALKISEYRISVDEIDRIIALGKELIDYPIELLDGTLETLEKLNNDYRLVMVTKGDLLDQQRKLRKSGLEGYFHHIEIVSDKSSTDYLRLLSKMEVEPEAFLMVGNSLKSDILPALEIGCPAVYIPYHLTWQHEKTEQSPDCHPNFYQIGHISELSNLLS